MFKATIVGPPRTKKTSNQIIQVKGRPMIIPSAQHKKWLKASAPQVAVAWRQRGMAEACEDNVHVAAIFYREKNLGDLIGYMQALADLLEHAGVLKNDRQITNWDGTRMFKDAADPRIELSVASEHLPAIGVGL